MSRTGYKPWIRSCFKAKERTQRGGVPTQIGNWLLPLPKWVGSYRSAPDGRQVAGLSRHVNAPQSGAAMGNGMNKVSKHAPLLLYCFWLLGDDGCSFASALPHKCEIWGCQSGTDKDFRLVGYDTVNRYQRFGGGFSLHLQDRASYLTFRVIFLNTGFGCNMTVRRRTTIIIIGCKCKDYTSNYLWIGKYLPECLYVIGTTANTVLQTYAKWSFFIRTLICKL